MASLRISELDFDNIKTNLKTFLKSYTDDTGNLIFTDFDFEGSSLSVLIDLLSYNTHYNAYLANMVANEMFLDSAVKRESAVSIAKHLGYTPASIRGAKAVISFEVINPSNSPISLTLDKYTVFSTTINGDIYSFVNVDPVTIEPLNGQYKFDNVSIVEGTPVEYVHRASNPGPAEKYEIPSDAVDTTSIRVLVQNSYTDTTTTLYTQVENITDINSQSTVYYLEENTEGKYQIYFGDGVLGKKLVAGNLIRLQYVVSQGMLGNVSGNITQTFTTSASIGGGNVPGEITAIQNSTGGADRDTIDSIKFKAPKFYSAQNRAVTATDYATIIQENYPLIESISAWGGEDNSPPEYGKVFISLKPYDGYVISSTIKNQITQDVLSNRRVMAMIPVIIDPEYIYINVSTSVEYDSKISTVSSSDMKLIVDIAIRDYFTNNLQKFGNDFVFSKLTKLIDNSNPAIVGNLTKVKIQKRINPKLNTTNLYTETTAIDFNNAILPSTLNSTGFNYYYEDSTIKVKIIDVSNENPYNLNGTGTLQLVNFENTKIINSKFGTINYGTGVISIPSLNLVGYPDNTSDIRFNAEVQSQNLYAKKNQILIIDDSTPNSESNRDAGLQINISAIK
jgi:hypothetical protein